MGSDSTPQSRPPWAETVDAGLRAEPQFQDRQLLYFPGSPEFDDSENDYFNAAAREVQSAAVVRPTSAADVAALLKVLRRHLPAATPIAVRGAGHATYGGTAKAAGGVTIDSTRFLSPNKRQNSPLYDIFPSLSGSMSYG
jgi:hypothetical protein